MSEELTVKSLRDRVSKSALPPDVKSDLLVQLRYAATPEQLAAIEARLTAEAPAFPAVKAPRESTASIRSGKYGVSVSAAPEYRAQPYSAPPPEVAYAEPTPELEPWQVIARLMDERDAFAVEKPNQRRPFTRAAFLEVARELGAGPTERRTHRALVEQVEALGETLRAYADNRYSQHPQVSDQNKTLFAAAVAEFYDQITRYLSAAQPFIALEGAPKIKTAPSSRAVLSEEDPRLLEAEQARKKQPTAPSPFATQARPLARARRSDVMRTVGEKGRLLNLFRRSATPARYAAVLVRFTPYGFRPENKSRRKRGGPMPARPSIYDPETIAVYLQNVGAMLEQYKESADVYYDTTEQAATTAREVASVKSARRAFAESFRQAQANYAKAQGLMEQLDAVYPQIDALQSSPQPDESTDKKIEKLFAQAQSIYDKIERISGRLMGQFGVPMGSGDTDDMPRENVDDFGLDIDEEIEDAYPDWLVDAVFLRYVCMYPMTFADAKDLIFKHRSTFAVTQDKFLKRPVVADVNVHGHFIVDMERLFRPKDTSIAQDVAALIDHAFMVNATGKGYVYLETARKSELAEIEKQEKEYKKEQAREAMLGDAAAAVQMFIDTLRSLYGDEATAARLARLEPRIDKRDRTPQSFKIGAQRKEPTSARYVFFDALADAKRLERVRRTGVREPRPDSDPETEEIIALVAPQFGDGSPQFELLVRESLAATLTEYRRKAEATRARTAAARDKVAREARKKADDEAATADEAARGQKALDLVKKMINDFGAAPFITRDWAGTQPSTYAEITFEDSLAGVRRGAEPIRKFLLDNAPKNVTSKHSTTPTVLLQDTVVEFLKQIRANFRPSAPNLPEEYLKEELLDYVNQISDVEVPVVTVIRKSDTRKNADESDDPTDTAEPFAAIEDVPVTPEEALAWPTQPPSEPTSQSPALSPMSASEFFINDWLNNNQNFFGLIINSVANLDEDVFAVFGPHNVVTIAQYYNEYKLLPRSVGADYLEPDVAEADEPDAPHTIIMRIDYDNVKSPIETLNGNTVSYPRAFRDLLQATSEEGVELPDVFRVQFIWPFASEPISIDVDDLVDGEYDDLFGEVVTVFLARQFDESYQQSDAVIKTILYDLHQRMEQLDAVAEDVAPRIRNYIGTMYKMTGRIAAISTWSQNTFINVISNWLDDLAEDPRKKEPWWLPYLIRPADLIDEDGNARPLQDLPLAAFKAIDFERRRDEASAAWKKEHDVASDTLALSAAQAGFMHVPTVAVHGRRGARVVAAIDPENKTVAWGQRKPLQVLSDEDYAARGFSPEMTAQWMDPERTFFTRTSVEAGPHAFVTVPTEVFERRVAATARYKVFDQVLDQYRALAKSIGDVKLRSRQQYENIDALIHAIDDPESIQPRWDVPPALAATAKTEYAAGRNWSGMNLNKRAVIAARGLGYLQSALTEVDPEAREKAANSYAAFINDTAEPLNAATVEILRADVEPRMIALHGSDPAAAVAALEELYQLAAEHPNNMVYTKALAFLGLDDVDGGRQPDAELPDDFGELSEEELAEELGEDEEPRENRGRRSRKPASAPRRKNRSLPPPPALSPVEARQVDQLRQGPAMLLRQSVVAHMDKAGGTASASALKEAFRKAVANLAKRGLLDTSTGQAVLTDRGRREEVALIRQMLKQRKMLRQIVEGYDRYVRLAAARANAVRQIGAKIKEVARQVPPPRPTPLPQRENPSGFALSGEVKTRRMYDPRTGTEVLTPVVEYRPQVFQDPPTFKKGSRQHQNRQRTQPPYRPRIYLPIDPDHPTTQAFFEDTSRPTHDTIRQTLDWSTHEHAAGTNVETYAPDELIPMGRKFRGAGPRGAAVKSKPVLTQVQKAKEEKQAKQAAEKERKAAEKRQADADALAVLAGKARDKIAQGKTPTPREKAAYDKFMASVATPPPPAPPPPAPRTPTPVSTPVSEDDDEMPVVPPSEIEEMLAKMRARQDEELEGRRAENARLRAAVETEAAPAPAEKSPVRRRQPAKPVAPVPETGYFKPAKLTPDNLDVEIGLAMTVRDAGGEGEEAYAANVGAARSALSRFSQPSKTAAARTNALRALLDVAEGRTADFSALQPYISPQTMMRLNTLPPGSFPDAAEDFANLLRTLVSRPNGAKVAPDHNDGSSAYGPRFQGFRVR